ncbi:MAG TPA: DUF2249 domain-containing protein [Longimicrobiaceae bacterium]|nr:DUF2249 domain-containing protein [Longimicrobiaceae bacterium]
MVIRRTDRVAEVLKRDEGLIDTFISVSDHFRGLRNPIMRKTMGRLATVEQAARVAGVDADLLVARLNAAVGEEPEEDGARQSENVQPEEESVMSTVDPGLPPELARIPSDQVVELDVREALRRGEEPFSQIMAARRQVSPGGALRLRAIFEPAPLYAVLKKQGLDHWTEKHAEDDWEVWFFPAGAGSRDSASGERSPVTPEPRAPDPDEDVIVLDVRGMEPPEPMVRTLAALEELPAGKTLLQINERVPQFLLPKLEELGFVYEVREQNDALVRVFIRRRKVS